MNSCQNHIGMNKKCIKDNERKEWMNLHWMLHQQWIRIHEDDEEMGFMLNIGWAWIQMHKNDGSNDFYVIPHINKSVWKQWKYKKNHKNVKDPWEQSLG
jgi:hypothetical protein